MVDTFLVKRGECVKSIIVDFEKELLIPEEAKESHKKLQEEKVMCFVTR